MVTTNYNVSELLWKVFLFMKRKIYCRYKVICILKCIEVFREKNGGKECIV